MKMQQNKRNKDECVALPREILIDILSTLPTRTVIKCKAVCKAWRDAIECVEFVRFRLSKPDPDPYPYLIIPKYPIHKIIELKGGCPLLRKVTEFSLPHQAAVHGTVNGLIFLGKLNHIFVCNPITREFVKLPNHHHRPHSSFNYNSYGFGVSRTSGQYKVVRIFQYKLQYGDSCTYTPHECQVYTLGTKEWRIIAVGAPPPPHWPTNSQFSSNTWNEKCLFAGGNLYWLDHRTETGVCCFDLETEAFATFATPPAPNKDRYGFRSLSVLDDRLSLCDVVWTDDQGRNVEVEIWVMRGGGDWIKDASGTSLFAFPIKVLEDGGKLLGERNRGLRDGLEGYSLLYEGVRQYTFDNASLCNLSFLSLKTLFAREDVQRFVHTKED